VALNNNGLLYGIIGVMGAALVGGGLYLYKDRGLSDDATSPLTAAAPQAPAPAPAAPAPVVVTPPATGPAIIVPAPNTAHIDQVNALVADARRAITRGDFQTADRALTQAERLEPRAAEVVSARRDLREAQMRDARQDRRVDGLVAQARAAIARRDYVAADRYLDEAERLDNRDRDVQQARTELNQAQRPAPDRPGPDRGDRDGRDNGGTGRR
jgi:tetratricopeptide (TPR) repeat protein